MISSSTTKKAAQRVATRTIRRQRRSFGNNAIMRNYRPAAMNLRRWLAQQRAYSTEKIVEMRSGKSKEQLPRTLYNAVDERENCGVGLIASLKSAPSRAIVEQADEMLVRMAHRGGCGCDPASGDGSGE